MLKFRSCYTELLWDQSTGFRVHRGTTVTMWWITSVVIGGKLLLGITNFVKLLKRSKPSSFAGISENEDGALHCLRDLAVTCDVVGSVIYHPRWSTTEAWLSRKSNKIIAWYTNHDKIHG